MEKSLQNHPTFTILARLAVQNFVSTHSYSVQPVPKTPRGRHLRATGQSPTSASARCRPRTCQFFRNAAGSSQSCSPLKSVQNSALYRFAGPHSCSSSGISRCQGQQINRSSIMRQGKGSDETYKRDIMPALGSPVVPALGGEGRNVWKL